MIVLTCICFYEPLWKVAGGSGWRCMRRVDTAVACLLILDAKSSGNTNPLLQQQQQQRRRRQQQQHGVQRGTQRAPGVGITSCQSCTCAGCHKITPGEAALPLRLLAQIEELGQHAQRVSESRHTPAHAHNSRRVGRTHMPMGSMMGLRRLAVAMALGTSRLLWRMSSSTPVWCVTRDV